MPMENGTIFTLDGVKYIVLVNINDNGINYAFLNQILDDESNVTQDYFIYKYNPDNTLVRIVEQSEIDRLFPKVQEELKKTMIENGIDVF